MKYLYLFFFILINNIYADELKVNSKLVIFTNHEKTIAATHFEKNALSDIRKIAEELKIEFIILESSKGLPAEITTLPAIVYVDDVGHSIYQGRYMTFDRVSNFIETSQNITQTDAFGLYKNIPTLKSGRTQIGIPIKVCEITGTKPSDYDIQRFIQESSKVIVKALPKFELKGEIQSHRTDKLFYMDFYPWVSDNGQLFLSAALFSQYHCKVPIWTTGKKPFEGRWKDRDKLFMDATIKMEEEIKKLSVNSLVGDAFDIVSDRVKTVTWEDLGFRILSKKKQESTSSKAEISSDWVVDSAKGQKTVVQFRLAPPNENFCGFAKKLEGEIKFTETAKGKRMQGWVKVKMDAVTMGEVELDAAILSKEMLNVISFPIASFDFDVPLNAESFSLYYGRENIIDVQGNFTFKNKTIPLKAEISLEPIVKKSVTILKLKSNFNFDLKEFGLTGAPNDSPNKDIIEFFVTLEMVQK